MTKPVVTRHKADEDLDIAFDYYLLEAGPEIAEAFINEFERVASYLSRNSTSGSTSIGHALAIKDLRQWPLRRFPYLIIYVDRGHIVEIWRVLHGQRDIPELMRLEE